MSRLNIGFLQDLLTSLIKGPTTNLPTSAANPENLQVICRDLLKKTGEASRVVTAAKALSAYAALSTAEKTAFFTHILVDYGPDPKPIKSAYEAWSKTESAADLTRLFDSVEPKRQALLRAMNHCPGGTFRLVQMRADLLEAARLDPALKSVDADFSHLFASWFNPGFLVLRQIDWNTSAAILEKIVAYEAVHEIGSWDDLRRRLDPSDRRCYAFFHHAIGDEPLIFVEVALTKGIPGDIAQVLADCTRIDPGQADTAVFYSISNCQQGLTGISFGNLLIKQVVQRLRLENPNLTSFVTLSPVPGFAKWLASSGSQAPELAATLATKAWAEDTTIAAALAPEVRAAAARYLVQAKARGGQPADPVARFHLGNGAELAAVHWPADRSRAGLERSHGVMVTYRYDLDQIEARNEAFATANTVAASAAVMGLVNPKHRKAQPPSPN